MNSLQVIRVLMHSIKEGELCLFTTGFISRCAFAVKERHANFYMLGSMGLLSSVGLGIALNTRRKIFIFDGDGSALMDLGTIAMIGNHAPKNLYHIVLDNEAYESTGGQPTISSKVDLSEIARAAGYRDVIKLEDIGKINTDFLFQKEGPVFILLKLKTELSESMPRVNLTPEELKARFRDYIRKGKR